MNKSGKVFVPRDLTFCECGRDFFWNLSTYSTYRRGDVTELKNSINSSFIDYL